MAVKYKPIPMSVIAAATKGDEKALAYIVRHYSDYIKALSTRLLQDSCGNEFLYVDDDIRLRLETKLIQSIITEFKILPE